MSAVDDFASDVNGLVADIEAQFKTLNDMKGKIKDQANTVAAGWSSYFAAQREGLQKAQDALNRISNAPVSQTPTQDTGSVHQVLSEAKVVR